MRCLNKCIITCASYQGFPDSSVGEESACKSPWFDSWVGKIPWRRDRLPTPVFLDFSCGSAGKESACNVGDLGSIPGLGRSPGERNGNPLQYTCWKICWTEEPSRLQSMGSWSQTRLSDFTFTFPTQGSNSHLLRLLPIPEKGNAKECSCLGR